MTHKGLPVTLENITVNVMDHIRPSFITGCNVLKYLNFSSYPSEDGFNVRLDLTAYGRSFLESDRQKGIANTMNYYYNLADVTKLAEVVNANQG